MKTCKKVSRCTINSKFFAIAVAYVFILYIIFKSAMLPVNATLQEIQVLMLASLYNTLILI
jgi:hypothetical protein